MTMYFIPSLFFYILSIYCFFEANSSVVLWVLMEINLLSLLALMLSHVDSLDFSIYPYLYYFLIQSLGSILFLFTVIMGSSFSKLSELFFLSSLVLKIGIFPLFGWIWKLRSSLSKVSLVYILTLQKIPMFLVLFGRLLEGWDVFLMLISMFYGCYMLFWSDSVVSMLIYSSLCNPFWIFFLFVSSKYLYLLFFLTYFLILLNTSFKDFSSSGINIILFMFTSGLPPFSLFFLKYYISTDLYDIQAPFLFFGFFWALSFFCFIGYSKFFFSSFFYMYKDIYSSSATLWSKNSSLLLATSVLLSFLVFAL